MAFRNKANLLKIYNADILVIQESENLDKLDLKELKEYPNRIWVGSNKHKGLLVVSKGNHPFERHSCYTEEYRYILPLMFHGEDDFNLFAVWAQDDKINLGNRYIGQVWLALKKYKDLLKASNVILGDFNSNVIWDKAYRRTTSHTDVVKLLGDANIHSLYHYQYQEEQGYETEKTLFFRKKMNCGYHIDYCFVSEVFLNSHANLNIPSYNDWIGYSDHRPLIIDLKVR
jgi:exonuclease III